MRFQFVNERREGLLLDIQRRHHDRVDADRKRHQFFCLDDAIGCNRGGERSAVDQC